MVLLAGTTLILALSFRYFTGVSFYLCLINAVPLGIISSAIAIPSAAHLTMKDREFITLESSLSDILGIIFFNYVVINTSISFFLAGKILLEIAGVTAVSLVFCLFLLYLLRFIEHSVKFVLILAVMVFLYSLGKSLHLSSLIMVLMYGLILKNIGLVPLGFIQKHFNNEKYLNEFTFMQQITAEGVFLVKTFFFVIFGFIIRPEALVSPANLKIAGIIVFVILAVRLISLAVLNRKIFPELFYAPRGLISILLFMSIPAEHYLEMLDINVLFLVIIFTSMVMILGSFWKAGPAEEKDHDFPV